MEEEHVQTFDPIQIAPKQLEGLQLCRDKKFVLFSGPRYSIKCVSPDTMLWTDCGVASIGTLASSPDTLVSPINRRVLSLHGETKIDLATATSFYNSGTRKAFSVKTHSGYELVCSSIHPIWCESNGEIRFRTPDEISVLLADGERVWIPLLRGQTQPWTTQQHSVRFGWYKEQERKQHSVSQRVRDAMRRGITGLTNISRQSKSAVPTVKKYVNRPFTQRTCTIEIDSEIGYLMGLFTGDGCYTKYITDHNRVGFSTLDQEIVDFLRDVLKRRFDAAFTCGGRCMYYCDSPLLRAFFVAVGMTPKYSYEKDIPEVILTSPMPVIVAFLQGLFDTDGASLKQGGATYCTTSLKLVQQVQNILLAMGIRSRRVYAPNEYRGAHILFPRIEDGFDSKVGFRLERKQARLRKKRKYDRSGSAYPPSLLEVISKRFIAGRIDKRDAIKKMRDGEASMSKDRIARIATALDCFEDSAFQRYWIGGNVWWEKLESVRVCESQLVDICVPETQNFVGNGFVNHNTVCSLIACCDHAWRTPLAEVAIVTVSQSAGLESGVWDQLVETVLPRFMACGQGMKWIKKPYTATVSKKPACVVSNAFGGKSRIQLESLKDEREVERRFKSKMYTMMYVPELSNFTQRRTFDIWAECLRSLHLNDDQYLFLADTNPPDDGDESWLYHLWFVTRTQTYAEYCDFQAERGLPMLPDRVFTALKQSLGLLQFEIADNIFASQQRIDELVARYSHDQDLYDRYILGKYVKASTGALFVKQFRDNIHVAGELETPGNQNPEILVPNDSTWRLCLTIDPGSSANSAGYIFEKVVCQLNDGGQAVPCFNVLDEVAIIGEDHTLEEFTEKLCDKMFWWEQRMGRVFDWQCWSDRSVFEQRDQSSRKFYHQLIFESSAKYWQQKFQETQIPQYATRTIALQAADRSKGSLEQRVDLARKLLFEERLRISRGCCPKLVQSFKSLPPAKNNANVPAKGHSAKHPFDAIMYGISEECYDEITAAVFRTLRKHRGRSESGLVSIAT